MKKLLVYGLLLALPASFISFDTPSASAKRHHRPHHRYEDRVETRSEVSAFAMRVLELANEERASRGIAPLRWSTTLQDPANLRAHEITQYFSHTRPNGRDCFSVFPKLNGSWGENIAGGQSTPEDVMDTWMHSPGHKKNILNPRFTEMAVGYCYDDNTDYGHYWVQLFKGR